MKRTESQKELPHLVFSDKTSRFSQSLYRKCMSKEQKRLAESNAIQAQEAYRLSVLETMRRERELRKQPIKTRVTIIQKEEGEDSVEETYVELFPTSSENEE